MSFFDFSLLCKSVGWAGLGWVGLDWIWAGLGWVLLGVEFGRIRMDCGLHCVGLSCAELG